MTASGEIRRSEGSSSPQESGEVRRRRGIPSPRESAELEALHAPRVIERRAVGNYDVVASLGRGGDLCAMPRTTTLFFTCSSFAALLLCAPTRAQAPPPTTSPSSGFTWGACGDSSYQNFKVEAPTGTGKIRDS